MQKLFALWGPLDLEDAFVLNEKLKQNDRLICHRPAVELKATGFASECFAFFNHFKYFSYGN